MSLALSSGGIGAPYLIMRSSVSDQPLGPKRCCTAISRLWQITQRMTSSHPSVWGIGDGCARTDDAPSPTATPSPTSAAASSASRHIDLDGVDDVPAVAEAVRRAASRLHAPETVAGPRHHREGAGLRVPVGLELPPRVALPRPGEPARGPRLSAVGGDVDPRELALARPRPAPDGDAAGCELGALGGPDDQRLDLE